MLKLSQNLETFLIFQTSRNTMAAVNELQNFVQKFTSLWRDGCSAKLQMETQHGDAWVSLHLSLGRPQHVCPPHPKKKCPGPSQLRRLKKRAAARRAAAAEDAHTRAQAAPENRTDVAVQAADTINALHTEEAAVQAVPTTKEAAAQATDTSPAVQAGPPGRVGQHHHPLQYRHPAFQLAEQADPPSLSPIPQQDGSTDRDFPKKCKACHKSFETRDDVAWHLGTKHGREDCQILKSMLQI